MNNTQIRRSPVYRCSSTVKSKIRYRNQHDVWVAKAGKALLDNQKQHIFEQICFAEPQHTQDIPYAEIIDLPEVDKLPPPGQARSDVTLAVARHDGITLELTGFRDIRDYDKTVGRILSAMAANYITREEATQLCWQLHHLRQNHQGS
ncbi:hypothetical protein Mmc1_2242 [Magnetococcus marinus MC-1]|uniref:Uncharacterized protein n=1 Tax=Magnetococcus marinus (strain ATCC BAA-1437 / JCM 17883 / MC-1) TaxID=156889 RepID=A0L9V0_MAGMM|nr:hypothetical protein [Magnetococcus marinus]ABK44743.1 hypothetical protein Mmc1_2242 [Magnetococcus marinus MC-1]